MKAISLRLPDDLADLVDRAAGQIPRERWIRDTLRAVLTDTSQRPSAIAYRAAADRPRKHLVGCDCPVCKPPRPKG